MIEVEHVSLQLQGATILADITVNLPKGELVALIGPNGAGKSSLLSLIARLQPLQTGSIRVDGLPVDTTPGPQLAKVMAVLRQNNSVSSRLRVAELVGFGRFPYSRGRLTAEDKDLVGQALARFDLYELADRFIDTLSGGQFQRSLVAMTYCQGTDYLILDEPLNNLDMFYARDLMQTLRKLVDDENRSVVIVLHDINHACAYADRVVAMKGGRIVEYGAPGEIVDTRFIREVYGFEAAVENVGGQRVVLHHR